MPAEGKRDQRRARKRERAKRAADHTTGVVSYAHIDNGMSLSRKNVDFSEVQSNLQKLCFNFNRITYHDVHFKSNARRDFFALFPVQQCRF